MGPVSETGGAFDPISGASLIGFPKFTGTIKIIQGDNAGGWFVGGQFASVDGYPITNLAHIFSDRRLDTQWTPNPDGSIPVRLYYKPLVLLIWLGAVVMVIGGGLSLSDRRLRVGAPKPARKQEKRGGALQPAE